MDAAGHHPDRRGGACRVGPRPVLTSLSDQERQELGAALGRAIVALFAAVARLDGVTLEEAMDAWVSGYFAERVTHDGD